jgi:tetratricopeptide (TPR) repeat protein
MGVEALDAAVCAGKGMTTNAALLPTGFLGPVRARGSLLPAAGAVLCLPAERAALQAADGERCSGIDVVSLTESLGRIEDLLTSITGRLIDGGICVLAVENAQSPRSLRLCVEGRPGSFDPAGSTTDPAQLLTLRRVLAAAGAAGLWVQDVIAVPASGDDSGQIARGLVAAGLLPFDWLTGSPPSGYWLVLQKSPQCAGSVLVAGGDAEARERTLAALDVFLPTDWEIVVGDAVLESAQWNRALARARGEVVWFLRAGSEPTAATFTALVAPGAILGAVPGHDGQRHRQGDLAGLMLPRLSALLAGPIGEHFCNTAVALEDHALRLDTRLPEAEVVDSAFQSPPPPVEAPSVFAAESRALLDRWSLVQGAFGVLPASVPAVEASPTSHATAIVTPPWAGQKPRISLCMIARNEQRFLRECLERAQAAVDEIVLVDTGSTDDTVAIAASFGAKVLHTPWTDDFSAPRNLGLAAATGDWILVLDADEFLRPGAAERIRALVEVPAALGYHLHFVNVYGEGRTLGVMMVRLFRNLPGITYQNVIHEQVTPSLQRIGAPLGLTLRSGDVTVDHYGYSDEVMDQRGKNERNERLFQKQLQQTPDDIYGLYKYGDFLRRLPGREVEARAFLDRCLERILAGSPSIARELPYASEVAALCALEAARVGDHDRAHGVIDTALRQFIATPNLHYLAASVALAKGQAEDAILHYRRCLAWRGQVLVVPVQEGITGHVSLCGIAQARLMRGDFRSAERLLRQAISLEPGFEGAHLAMSKLWLLQGEVAKALTVLTDYLATHPEAPGACQQVTVLLQKLGQKDAARRMGRHALQVLQQKRLVADATAMQEILAAL